MLLFGGLVPFDVSELVDDSRILDTELPKKKKKLAPSAAQSCLLIPDFYSNIQVKNELNTDATRKSGKGKGR